MPDPDAPDLDRLEQSFSRCAERWSTIALRSAAANGAPDTVAKTVAALRSLLVKLIHRLFRIIRELFDTVNPFGLLVPAGAFIEAGLDEMFETLSDLLEEVDTALGAALDAAVAAALALFEAIKKAFHLVLDRVKLPALTEPAELLLDLVNNVMGNIAELVSPAAGQSAIRFRSAMYLQLAEIRSARAARPGPPPEAEPEPGR